MPGLQLGLRTVPAVRRCLPREIAAFQRDGAVCLRGAVPRAWVEALRCGVEANRRDPGPHAEVRRQQRAKRREGGREKEKEKRRSDDNFFFSPLYAFSLSLSLSLSLSSV